MPVCFQLYPKGAQEPEKLQIVDDKMREAFEQPSDPDNWLGGWYDSIGFRLAMGKTFEEIRTRFEAYIAEGNAVSYYTMALELLTWLEEHYTVDSWREMR